MRYGITLGYDGTAYRGWQRQTGGGTIQDAVEAACEKLFCERVCVTGSGRTDAGVHAIAQVAHFDANKTLPEKNVVSGLNAYLPRDIRVVRAWYANENFDARKSAKKKTYMYVMYKGDLPPVINDRAAAVRPDIDVAAMKIAAKELIGTHDFSTFKASGGGAKTSVRTVFDARFEEEGNIVKFFISADGFLYNMVRIIVAQLVKTGEGKAERSIKELIELKDRSYAKELAPACGLYLYGVEYDTNNASEKST